jgi:drug/metabolite transporter (DMT)-like permease
MAYLQSC